MRRSLSARAAVIVATAILAAYALPSCRGQADVNGRAPIVTTSSLSSGYAGASVTIDGRGFGAKAGVVRWGRRSCAITLWTAHRITAYVPDDARPGRADLTIVVGRRSSAPVPFTVVPPEFRPSKTMVDALGFVRDKMRNREGGVYSNYLDTDTVDPVYLDGHNVTSEQMGLMLWVTAALLDHRTFEQSYQYVVKRMISPRFGIVNWAVDKRSGRPYTGPDQNNSPLDDFRVIEGLISGWEQWKDERYLALARTIGKGLLATSVSKPVDFPRYPGGLVSTGFDWSESKRRGHTEVEVVPVDYADLWTMRWLAADDPRWVRVIHEDTRLMEDAQIANGQFHNSYNQSTRSFSGDFEYQGQIAGTRIMTAQSLWTAIHLARTGVLDAARRALSFYERTYKRDGRIAEYYNLDGTYPSEAYFRDTNVNGDVRIYALTARLAYYLNDRAFGDQLVSDQIVGAANTDANSPTRGQLGRSHDDAAAWESLEGLLALAMQRKSSVLTAAFSDGRPGR